MTNFSAEGEAPVSRSEENAKLVYVYSSHPKRAFRIRANLSAQDKVRSKDFLSNNLDVFA